MADKVIKRYVIGDRIELIKTEYKNIIVIKDSYTYIDYSVFKKKYKNLLNDFFRN